MGDNCGGFGYSGHRTDYPISVVDPFADDTFAPFERTQIDECPGRFGDDADLFQTFDQFGILVDFLDNTHNFALQANTDKRRRKSSYLLSRFEFLATETVEQQSQEEIEYQEVAHDEGRQEDGEANLRALNVMRGYMGRCWEGKLSLEFVNLPSCVRLSCNPRAARPTLRTGCGRSS